MSAAIWLTPAGDLGIIPELEFYELALDAYNPAGGDITFSLIAGNLPPGLELKNDGTIQGLPVNGEVQGVPFAVSKVTTSTFSVRVTNPQGLVTDRTFNLTVAGMLPPIIIPNTTELGSYIDGDYVDIQLDAIEANNLLTATFSLLGGELPPGLTLTSDGRIYGYILPVTTEQTDDDQGFDVSQFDRYTFDFSGVNIDKNFQFVVQADDTVNVSTQTYYIYVYARINLTTDNSLITADLNTTITADTVTVYNPVLYTEEGSIGNVRQNTRFAFKFDAVDFDNETLTYNLASGSLPTGLSLNTTTGWITGLTPYGPLGSVTYDFSINATKVVVSATYVSQTRDYTIKLLGQISDTVTWISPSDLGMIYNGAISELSVSAYTDSNRQLNYRLTTIGAMPIGLNLLSDGTISGRVSFEVFELDGGTVTFDENATTCDQVYTFTVETYDSSNLVSDSKEFSITIDRRDARPYENLYIQLMVNRTQRGYYDNIVNNTDIFPPEYIYRPYDPWYGKNTYRRSLFLTGLNASDAADYINAMTLNHYWKTLTFGSVKTAQALDDNFDVKYEVVYLEIIDSGVNSQGLGPNLSISWPTNSANISTVYTNSFPNMAERVGDDIGYQDRSILPDWMTSRQTDGRVLGFTRGLILCYANPGKSAEIAYRVEQEINTLNLIDFTIDRYEWDSILSDNFSRSPYYGTGLIFTSTFSNLVTGVGTDFTHEPGLISGQTIFVSNGSIGVVDTISNATSLTLTANSAGAYGFGAIWRYSSNIFIINNFVSGTGTITANTNSNVLVGIATNITGTGTISGNTVSSVITGNNTVFNTQLAVGKTLYYSGNSLGTITSITSANILTLSGPLSSDISGVSYTAQGVSTAFATELHVGDTISVTNVNIGTVKTIVSNTALILTANSVSNVANVAFSHTNRDPYTVPGQGDKYLKYPQIGVIA